MAFRFFRQSARFSTMALLPFSVQIKAWRKANRKMQWGIPVAEFDRIAPPPGLTPADRHSGFIGAVLSYGFGDDGRGNADSVLSGKLAWEYARTCRKKRSWQSEHISFESQEHMRLRPSAPPRPKGFYYAKFKPGDPLRYLTVSQFLSRLSEDTGLGPEGIQLTAITHAFFADLMNERQATFMALADYDIALQGDGDFGDVLQIFCSDGVLGLGVGKVQRSYPLFGIPTIRF